MERNSSDKIGGRFIKGRKQEALAEIESWVGGSREEVIKAGAAKVASHPAKNITEQKMLDAQLYEMSKQRFHFVVKCQWQSRLFLQKQQRKTAVMRDLLRNVDKSILTENPFSAHKKAEQSRLSPTKVQRSISSKSVSYIDRSVPGKISKTDSPSAFITQKQPLAEGESFLDNRKLDGLPVINLKREKSKDKDWMWPVHDDRYVKLSEVLCDTYPKVVHLQAKRSNLNLLKVNTGH